MNLRIRDFRPKTASVLLLVLAFDLLLSRSIIAGPKQNNRFPSIKINNFGQMDDRFYRGGQPRKGEYKVLADLGIKTIIDLRDDPTSYEKTAVEALGMHYVNIPMSDSKRPSEIQIAQFLNLAKDPATGKFYVHCAGGRHRTGVIGAVYRYVFYSWDFEQVYKEMKDFDFYTRWGHGALKDWVMDYYQRIRAGQVHTLAIAGATP